ncbi:hypothetical protein B7494_g1867 [Chlorociboria aeruginascens]|nr:hypothetical protein B7494_g1867 [Chlorociboria aeruginascens]
MSMFFRQFKVFWISRPRYSALPRVNFRDANPDINEKRDEEPEDDNQEVSGKFNLRKSSISANLIPWCILTFGISIGVILGILALNWVRRLETNPSRVKVKQFAPDMPVTTVVFSKTPELSGPPNEENDSFWDSLTPIGNGFVNISNPEIYDLKPGISTATGVDRYSVAMYHQIHCLGMIRQNYWGLIESLSDENMSSESRKEVAHHQLYRNHPQHCFSYLAQSIMCAGDLTIEWAKVERNGKREGVDGWGIGHQCKDPNAIRSWMLKHHGPPKAGDSHHHHI